MNDTKNRKYSFMIESLSRYVSGLFGDLATFFNKIEQSKTQFHEAFIS